MGSDSNDLIDVNTAQISFMGLHLLCSTKFKQIFTIDTNVAIVVNVGMEHFGEESDFWRLVRVVVLEVYLQTECAALPYRVDRAENERLPLENVIDIRSGDNPLIVVLSYFL